MQKNEKGASSFTKLFCLAVLTISLLTNPTSSVATAPVEKITAVVGGDSWYVPDHIISFKPSQFIEEKQ